ncbi:hypothetical protein BSKO_04797 [Bryopsis sp. KO-2023]|nr:hypothetical protein BSKO_04797 [Bryopsis sp. KO-2023]
MSFPRRGAPSGRGAVLALSFAALCIISGKCGGLGDIQEKGIKTRELLQSGEKGATITITKSNEKEFPELVANAKSGTTFVIASLVIRLGKPLTIKKPITIKGKLESDVRPKIDCKGEPGWITISSDGVVLKDCIITNCNGPAVRIFNEVFEDPWAEPKSLKDTPFLEVRILRVDFVANRDEEPGFKDDGGGIGISAGCDVKVDKCTFESNVAQLGAGIHVRTGASLRVRDSTFVDNVARISGAGISTSTFLSDVVATSFVVERCLFSGNRDIDGVGDSSGLQLQGVGSPLETSQFLSFPAPQASGGGIYVSGFDKVVIRESVFDGNSAVPAGGAVFITDNSDVVLENNLFKNNFVRSSQKEARRPNLELGGAVYVMFVDQSSRISITSSLFENNTATYGGALHMVTPLTTLPSITSCVFESNVAYLGGGAVIIRNAIQVNMMDVKMYNNKAAAGGGLMLTNGAGAYFIQGVDDSRACRFENNTAEDGGGWFFLGAGQVNSQAVKFVRNRAKRNGGAAYLVESLASGRVAFQDCEYSYNSAVRGGAIFMSSIECLEIRASHGATNVFTRNRAAAGGAMYLKPISQVNNDVNVMQANFVGNEALVDYHELEEDFDLPSLEEAGNERRKLLEAEENLISESLGGPLLEATGDDPCLPGGGGAICLVLTQVPERARVNADVAQVKFDSNSANTGGALFIATEKNSEWFGHCPESTTGLSSKPCRGLGIRASNFSGNDATGAGGAMFMTDSNAVHYDSSHKELPPFNFVPLSRLLSGDVSEKGFLGNSVSVGGFGMDVASRATHLDLSAGKDDGKAYFVEDHVSGTKLPPIKVKIMDAYGEIVSAGLSDSIMKVTARSENVAGQLVSTAVGGVVTFDSLTVTADPGTYNLTFAAEGLPLITTEFSIRGCMVGEFNVTDKKICTNCSTGFYGLDPMVPCQQCDEKAMCSGGPVIVPVDGWWHSTPFSPLIHECLTEEACAFDGRSNLLSSFYLDRPNLDPSNDTVKNDAYPQCNDGYMGVLCGSCSLGYGHFAGGECVKCNKSKRLTALFIFLVALWTLILLGFTIRSELSAIRDFNEMRTIVARKARKKTRPTPRQINTASRTISPLPPSKNLGAINPMTVFYGAEKETTNGGSVPDQTSIEVVSIHKTRDVTRTAEIWSENANASVDHIIAAENVSETVKIATNFLQVTSVALAINADWTNGIEKMLAVQDILAGFSNGASLVALDCVLEHDSSIPMSIRALIIRIAFPMILLLIMVALFFLYWLYLYRKRGEPIAYFQSRTIISFLVVLFFAYEFVTQELMRTLNCVEVDAADGDESGFPYSQYAIAQGRYWGEDTSLKCFEGSHARLVGILGAPGLVVFSFGIPLFLFIFLLWNKENDKLNDQAFLNTYGFFFQNYKEKFVYWEVATMMRKALVGGIVVFAYPLGANLQGVLALGVLIVSLVLHLVALPYKYKMLNMLEGTSLVVSIFMFYSGIVFNDSNTSEAARIFLSSLLVVLNFGLVVLFVFRGFQQVNKFFAAKLHCLQVSVPDTFLGRLYKFTLITVSRAAVQAQEQGKNHPIVKTMSKSIRQLQTRSAKLGKTVSRRVSKVRPQQQGEGGGQSMGGRGGGLESRGSAHQRGQVLHFPSFRTVSSSSKSKGLGNIQEGAEKKR